MRSTWTLIGTLAVLALAGVATAAAAEPPATAPAAPEPPAAGCAAPFDLAAALAAGEPAVSPAPAPVEGPEREWLTPPFKKGFCHCGCGVPCTTSADCGGSPCRPYVTCC